MKKIIALSTLLILILTACTRLFIEEPVFNNPADSTSYAYVGEDGNVAAVEGFAISSTETTIDLSWTAYPATGATVKVLRKAGSQPTDYTDGTEVFSESGSPDSFSQSTENDEITAGTDYFYGVYATGNGQNSQMLILPGRTTHYFAIYNANGATGGTVPSDMTLYKKDDTVTVADNTGSLVNSGYIFYGWNTAADGSGTSYTSGATLTMGTADIVLYAQWHLGTTNSQGMNMLPVISSSEIPKTASLQGGTDNVTLTRAFAMSETEVTQKQYETIMGRAESWSSSYGVGDNYPAYYVSWYEAAEFCNKLSLAESKTQCYYSDSGYTDPYEASDGNSLYWKKEANGYRLPTESEWEYAAKGGESYTYAGSDVIGDVAWYQGNADDGYWFTPHADNEGTQIVKGKQANGYGLYDMSGNVWEWCYDWYTSSYSGGTDPEGASSGSSRVLRGGGWFNNASGCTVSNRGSNNPGNSSDSMGFRVVTTNSYISKTVTYNANGADSGTVPDSATYGIGSSVTVAGNTGSLAKSGYVFQGWNTNADGSGTAYSSGSTFDIGTEDVVLYAQWREGTTNTAGQNMITIISSTETPKSATIQSTSVSFTRAFAMSETEVTQKQYETIMGRAESWSSSYGVGDHYPAYYVSWYEAVEFCNKLSLAESKTQCYYADSGYTDPYEASDGNSLYWKKEANGYRLPTESEWEYAAKGGASTGSASDYTYAGSDTIDDVAWYSGNSGKTHSVKGKQANGYGLYDMSGNVREWCYDWWSSSYSGGTDPGGASSGSDRVLRGGSWNDNATNCTVSARYYYNPNYSYDHNGFRVVCSP